MIRKKIMAAALPVILLLAGCGSQADKTADAKPTEPAAEVSAAPTEPAASGKEDPEKTIWDYLMGKIGNAYGAAGLMGNLYAESGLKANNLQNSFNKKLNITDEEYTRLVDCGNYPDFIADKAGYGLA